MASLTALKSGDVLGRFQLLVPIGAGGMGRVWVAREQGLIARPRLVAIKTALAEEAASEEFWKVLLDEARIASQIQHPNVCSIHALDRERGVVYLVMDWSDGGSLRELLDSQQGGRLEYPLAARIIAHVCAGLHAAHELVGEDGALLHVVHRDVSPQNVLISASGQVQITDFGVAKARGQIHAPTQTGEVKGKLSYMAPEQVTTRDVDRRADVFALGCVLYEASVGARPFHGDDALATLYQLLEQPIKPPSALDPSYPQGLERIVLKSLERDADQRYQSTEEMGRALQMWLASERALVADSDIATLVSSSLGDRISERAQSVENTMVALDSPPEPEPEPEPEEELGRKNGIETLSGSAASTSPGNLGERSKKGRWITLAAAAAAVIAVAVVVSRGSLAQAPAPAAALSPSLPEAPRVEPAPAPQKVTVTLRSEPAEAELSIDDGPPLPSPYVVNVAPDSRVHRVRARLNGFETSEQEVLFDRDRLVAFTLTAVPTANNRKPTSRATPRPATATPTTTTPTTVATPRTVGPGELPERTKKAPRTLDNDNPFAKKP